MSRFRRKVLLALSLLITGTVASQQPPQTPQIPTHQKPESTIKGKTGGHREVANTAHAVPLVPLTHSDSGYVERQTNAQQRSNEASEFWILFGRRVKVTDSLLAAFTFLLFVATLFLWRATQELVRDAHRTAYQQLRAYVFGKGFTPGLNLDDDGSILEHLVFVEWENVGLTPATDVRSWMIAKTVPSVAPEPKFTLPSASRATAVMGPKSTVRTGPEIITHEAMMANWRKEKQIWVWSRIEYCDILNPTVLHHHEQCARVALIHDPSVAHPRGHPPYVTFPIEGSQNSFG